jgi:hypothetical protein
MSFIESEPYRKEHGGRKMRFAFVYDDKDFPFVEPVR